MTIFNTPVLSFVLRWFSRMCLRLAGWRAIGKVPSDVPRAVMIVAPHTSYWDFLLFVLIVFDLELQLRVLIKHTLFVGPVGWFLRYCGALPVDRRAPSALVRQLAGQLKNSEECIVLITPEGTRSPRAEWKTGFYRMAEEAEVPIVIAYVDVVTKTAGIDHVMQPSGDIEADMKKIKAFYDTKTGIKPENYAS